MNNYIIYVISLFVHFTANYLLSAQQEASIWQKLREIMDLDLLKDWTFVHIILGLALVYTSTIGFSMLFPFFLQEGIGFNRRDTTICMSLLSGADILARLSIPLIAKALNLGNRMTFLIGASVLGLCRSCKQFA